MATSGTGGPSPRKQRKIGNGDKVASNGAGDEIDEIDLSSSDYDEETRTALEEIEAWQTEIDSLTAKASEEILKVEQRYNKMRSPFYIKRNELIKKIPNFWVTVFANHPEIRLLVDEEQEECLTFLTKLEVEETEDIKSGYKLKFFFDDNEFFENKVLIKEFRFGTSEPSSHSSKIKWKAGMDFTKKSNQPPTAPGKKRVHIEPDTFFEWFADNKNAAEDRTAELIKDEVWIDPLQFFLVREIECGDEDCDSKEDDDDDEAIVVEDDDDDDEDEDTDQDEDVLLENDPESEGDDNDDVQEEVVSGDEVNDKGA